MQRALSTGRTLRPCFRQTQRHFVLMRTKKAAPKLQLRRMWLAQQFGMSTEVDRSLYVLPNESPICVLDCEEAFKLLSAQEKRYAHHIAQASFDGALSVFMQVSPESPILFATFYRLFKEDSYDKVKELALSQGWTEEEWTGFVVYIAGFYANGGNYKGFGDSKIIPNISVDKIEALLAASTAASRHPHLLKNFGKIKHLVASLAKNQLQLGFGQEGVTTYHSDNVTKEDAQLIDKFFKSKNLESWNTRLFKEDEPRNGKTVFRIRMASGQQDGPVEHEFEGVTVIVENGDYAPLMCRTVQHLSQAIDAAANENQKTMLTKYVAHFTSGKIDEHKDGSRSWIRDIGPSVESYIGFIENYRDPAGTRSEFEGFVACVNKETSKKFQALVEQAEEILKRLPWGAPYEKDKFLKPDFTALDVIAFASSGIPSGINIPNYDDIRQNEGFKNVSLGNVISAMPKQKMNFLDQEDEILRQVLSEQTGEISGCYSARRFVKWAPKKRSSTNVAWSMTKNNGGIFDIHADLMYKYMKESFEVQVGLHELLGHGSGKLFQKNADGTFNFDRSTKHLVTGEPVTTWYEHGETWSAKFGVLASAYEECRAEAVGYYLSCDSDILKIFGYEGDVGQTVKYVNWLNEIRAGLLALEFYSPEKKKWGQAHCYARYVLTKVCLEAGEGFVKIEETQGEDGKPDLSFKLHRTKIDSVGKPAINAFLAKLQVYKSTGDVAGGTALFEGYGKITSKELHWRDICVARRKPRRIFLQANTRIDSNGDVELVSYEATPKGAIESMVDRYENLVVCHVEKLWKKDQKWFPSAYSV